MTTKSPIKLPAPVFDDPRHHIRLYQGDSLEPLPESSVDLIFADPPYFLSNGGITCHTGKMVSVNKGAWDKSRGPDLITNSTAPGSPPPSGSSNPTAPSGSPAPPTSSTASASPCSSSASSFATTSPGSSPTLLPISRAAISPTPPKPSSGPPRTKSPATPSTTSS